MRIRGERECRECGDRWSYYETSSIECPECKSLWSVGVDERTAHTDAPSVLDLSAHRARFGEARGTLPEEGVDDLKTDLRSYARKRGFIRGGELLPLDETYLAARELLEAVDCYDRLRDPTDRDREYLLDLLSGADDGDRPAAEHVPDSLREARGMAAVRAVGEYRGDVLAFLDDLEDVGETDSGHAVSVSGDDIRTRAAPAREILERLRDQIKRIEALNGDVPPADTDVLVDASNALGEYVRTGDESALDRAYRRLPNETA